jgi:hypothetical protein
MSDSGRKFDRKFSDTDLMVSGDLTGFCPVQGVGTVAGRRFYFRARHDSWSFSVAYSPEDDPVDIQLPDQGFLREGIFGTREDASWMLPRGTSNGKKLKAVFLPSLLLK